MSQMAPEAPPRRRDNAFTRKIGPLPMWAWLAIIATGIVIWAVYSARKNAQASQQQQSTTSSGDVPDFILQDYQQTGPPGPPGPAGPAGPSGGGPNGGGAQFTPVTPGPNAVTPITNPGGNVRGGGTPARPVTAGPVQYGTGPEKAAPVRARGNVRTSPKAPHPARKPAPRHTAPRHPARG